MDRVVLIASHFQDKLFFTFGAKIWGDILTSTSFADFLTVEKLTTTGLLALAVWWLTKEKARLENKYSDIIKDKEKTISDLTEKLIDKK